MVVKFSLKTCHGLITVVQYEWWYHSVTSPQISLFSKGRENKSCHFNAISYIHVPLKSLIRSRPSMDCSLFQLFFFSSGESVSCAVVFVLVYYFMMAGVMWFMILAYAWHLMFRAFGVKRDVIENKRGHFHLVAWTFPLVLTIVCLALTQVCR